MKKKIVREGKVNSTGAIPPNPPQEQLFTESLTQSDC